MNKKAASNIIFLNPGEYFHGAIKGAATSLKVKVSEHAQSYLVNLLSHFISSDNFFPQGNAGQPVETLTEQLAHALEEEARSKRLLRLKQLGDFSLYVSGFFSNSLNKKLVDVDYYIGMGETAYGNVARLEGKAARSELFLELSDKFPDLVELLGQISEEAGFMLKDDKDLLRLYDLWQKTGSERLAKILVQAGINTSIKRGDGSQEDA